MFPRAEGQLTGEAPSRPVTETCVAAARALLAAPLRLPAPGPSVRHERPSTRPLLSLRWETNFKRKNLC